MNQTITLAYPQVKTGMAVRMLMAVKMLLVIPFGVTMASLVLYLTHQIHLTDFSAINVTASFVGTTGLLRIAAGWLADRYLNHRYILLLSAVFMFVGSILTAIPQLVYWGVASIGLGSAFTIVVNCILTNMFQQDDINREKAFLNNYSVMNIGFIISFIISGYYELNHQYQSLFMVSGGFSFVALLLISIGWCTLSAHDKNHPTDNLYKNLIAIALIFIMYFGLYELIKVTSSDKWYFQFINIITAFSIIIYFIRNNSRKTKNNLFTYFIFIFPVLVFSTIHNLMPLILTLFIERHVDNYHFGLIIPPQWTQLIGTLTIIIGGPTLCYFFNNLRKYGIKVNTAIQFSIGLMLIGISLLIISIGIWLSGTGNLVHLNWFVVSNLLQGIAELLIAPIGFAMIAKIAPSCSRGTMMGIWLLLLSMGAIFAGYISNMVSDVNISFLMLGSFSFIFGIIIYLFRFKQI